MSTISFFSLSRIFRYGEAVPGQEEPLHPVPPLRRPLRPRRHEGTGSRGRSLERRRQRQRRPQAPEGGDQGPEGQVQAGGEELAGGEEALSNSLKYKYFDELQERNVLLDELIRRQDSLAGKDSSAADPRNIASDLQVRRKNPRAIYVRINY